MSSTDLNESELEGLKARADLLGVKYHPSISADKLREKIKAADTGEAKAEDVKADPGESENQKRARRIAEANKLVRIRVTCMNPAKTEWPGEIFTTGNAAVGTIKKYVPFNADDGWHVPQMIYQMMKDRQCQVFVTEKAKGGVAVKRSKMIKEFNIEVLDPLTPEELQELARRQAMADGKSE